MNLEEWSKHELEKREYVWKALDKLRSGHNVDVFEDLVPEFKNLKDKSYTTFHRGGSLEACEFIPSCNLGLLMGSGLYEKILVPLACLPDKTAFKIKYGLYENSGSRLNFEQFLRLIKDGKLKIYPYEPLKKYKARFYQEIFKSCEEVPPLPRLRIGTFSLALKLTEIAASEKITSSESLCKQALKMPPKYNPSKCSLEVEQIFGSYLDNYSLVQQFPRKEHVASILGSMILNLRIHGFEGVAEIALKCARLNKDFGAYALEGFTEYLVSPLAYNLLAFNNYTLHDIERMSFFKSIPKNLRILWKDIFSSSPAASSVVSHLVGLDTVELKGTELLKLIEDFADDENTKSLRQNMVDLNKALGSFDISKAERSFNKVDQIITESINSEVRGYARKGRVASHLLCLGKTFTAWTANAPTMLSGLLGGSGKFSWVAATTAGSGTSIWARERLDEIKVENIVRWWSRTWPFEDLGIGFVMWKNSC